MKGKDSRAGFRKDRPTRMPLPKQHDTYASSRKAADAMVCDDCKVVYHGGKWFWGAPPLADVKDGLCPACRRIRDGYPAGTIHVPAAFLERREEVLGMIRNAEAAEKEEHPLERLMAVEDAPDGGLVVTTTGIHLSRAITSKLERRFHRKAHVHYPEEQHQMHVDWKE